MGGIYREALERLYNIYIYFISVEDLFSDIIDLFIPCPNNREGYKFNTDKYIPNPKHCSVEAMDMFKTVGYLIGISLRTQNCKPFYFPSIIWKYLVDKNVDIFDLKDIDNRFIKFIQDIQNFDDTQPYAEKMFNDTFDNLTFTIQSIFIIIY